MLSTLPRPTPIKKSRLALQARITGRFRWEVLRRYQLSIVGNATASRSELALYVSGEFPPDRFVRAPAAAR